MLPNRHLNNLSASVKQTTSHPAMIEHLVADDTPGRSPAACCPLSASITAVSGSAWMNGCATCGKLLDEKNTPENTHIGSITRFMRPDAPSTVRARDATSNPIPPNASDDSTQIAMSCANDPRSGTPNTSVPKPSNVATSITSRRQSEKQERRQVLRALHWRRDQSLEQLLLPGVDDREANSPDTAAHQVHSEQTGHHEVDVARALLAHLRLGNSHRVLLPAGMLHRAIDDESSCARLGPRIIEAILDAAIGRGAPRRARPSRFAAPPLRLCRRASSTTTSCAFLSESTTGLFATL